MRNKERLSQLKLMAFDVDGVLTDGKLYFTPSGEEAKAFSTLDGHGLTMLREAGITLALITGRTSTALAHRAQDLKIAHLLQGVQDKRKTMEMLLAQHALSWYQAGYMGDDIVDLPILRACGFSASVHEGHPLVRQHVHYVAAQPAGAGAAREVCEYILDAQGHLKSLFASYLA